MGIVLAEISVVIAASSHNPSLLNPDFLRYNEIVPPEFELARPPLSSEAIAQVAYNQRFAILSQPGRITFTEDLSEKTLDEITCPQIAARYVETIPHVKYTAVGLNPKGYFSVEEPAREFLLERLTADKPWRSFRGVRPVLEAKFVYTFEDKVLSVNVEAGRLSNPAVEIPSAILFTGNIHRDVNEELERNSSKRAIQILRNFREDLSDFSELVDSRFLEALSDS